jgi:hypothetical protein
MEKLPMAMNKLAMDAITSPNRSAYQAWLIEEAHEVTAGYTKRATREMILQHLLVASLNDGLPTEITATLRGVGSVVNSILDIIGYNEAWHIDVI